MSIPVIHSCVIGVACVIGVTFIIGVDKLYNTFMCDRCMYYTCSLVIGMNVLLVWLGMNVLGMNVLLE